MDSTISPIALLNLNLSGTDKIVTGEIEALPTNFPNIKSGESLLLKVLLSENMTQPDSLLTALKVSLPQQQNQPPLELKLDTPLRLPEQTENQIAVKISAVYPEKLEVKLVSINNEQPAKFIAQQMPLPNENGVPTAATQTPIADKGTLQTSALPEQTLIIETGTSAKNVVFHPLEVPQLIENLAQPLNLPDNALMQIVTALQGARINVSLTSIIPENMSPEENGLTNTDYVLLSQLDKPLQNSLENIRSVLTQFSEQTGENKASVEQVQEVIKQIKNEFLPYSNQPLLGEAVSQPDNRLLALKTILGNVLPETPLKVENGSKAVLELKEITFPEASPRFSVADILSSVKLIEEAVNLPSILNNAAKPEVLPSPHGIGGILEPLKDSEYQDLSAKIAAKLPSFDNKMLPNTVNFIRGAVTHNLEAWLGKEIVRELNASGAEGRETAARLEGLLSSSVREGVSWRQVEIPLFNGETVSKIKIAVKKQSEEEGRKQTDNKNKGGTRFVVDTSFSVLGEFQFDGFSRADDRRFDLIVRTSREVGNDLYANILRLYKTTLNNLEYYGNIKINVKENFIKICEDESHGETLKSGIYI